MTNSDCHTCGWVCVVVVMVYVHTCPQMCIWTCTGVCTPTSVCHFSQGSQTVKAGGGDEGGFPETFLG